MCDMYGEECFSKKKMLTNGLNMGLPQQARIEKKKFMEWKQKEFMVKIKFLVLRPAKKVMLSSGT